MRQDYPEWLAKQGSAENTQTAQLYRVKKVEECYGSLDEHFVNNTFQGVINALQYSSRDEKANKPNPSKIKFEGNIHNNLQSYKSAVVRYQKFLHDSEFENNTPVDNAAIESFDSLTFSEESKQRLSLERDMQAALRRNIASLDPLLRIIDDGAERAVASGLIDITCEDDRSIVVVELKAGKADSRAIAQILGYMGDLHEEEDGRAVRGILVAHDFDKRTRSAARVVPTLTLKKYSIEFTFIAEE